MTIQQPIPDFAAARDAMIENQLRPQGVTDKAVLAAMRSVPREQFVADHSRPLAYVDRSVAIGNGRFMPAPAVLGLLLTQMAPQEGERTLVVGGGTGYAAAVLKGAGLDVLALESDPALASRARELGIEVAEGPLAEGAPARGPFDIVLFDGAIEYIPEAIVDQLANGGRLGAPLVDRGITRLAIGRKAAGGFGYLTVGDAGVAALPGFSRPRGFTF